MAQTTYRLTVNLVDCNANSGNVTGSFNTNVYKSNEDAQIMRWLSPLEPNGRHEGVRNDRFDGAGDWLLETSEFREWRECDGGIDKAVLFCPGNPGVGKTYMSSLVIDSLCDQARKEDISVAGFYFDFLAQQEQTITNMMGAILKQLVGKGDIPKYLREEFEKGKTELGGRRLRLPDLMGMLGVAIASQTRVFICIDALDECLPKHLPDLLKSLGDIVRESPKTRIFLTGRPHVGEEVQRYFSKAVAIPISPNTDDIKSYLEMRLDNDPEPEAMNRDLRESIMRIMLEKTSDIFLLVSLNMDSILGGATIRQRRKKLEGVTRGNGLGDAYTTTLDRVRAQKGDKSILGLNTLMWVLYSERPLRAVELCHALGVEVGSADLDPENIPTIRTLLSSSLGLVTVEASSSTVRLVHYTLKEHLLNDPTLFHNPHPTIAEVCLTYLNSECVRDLPPTLGSAPPTMPLLEYASCYWGEHARRGMTEDGKALALRLLDRFDEHISVQVMLSCFSQSGLGPYFGQAGGFTGFTGFHGVAFLGIVGMIGSVLEFKNWDVNATDSSGRTALTWAAVRGQEEAVKILLERVEVNPDQADTEYGRTPLSWAAGYAHEGVVKVLLELADVNPDQADTQDGRTPLSHAAGQGHEGVVKMLLERVDVNPDKADTRCGRTPLSHAAGQGNEGVVEMLLERTDVNPNQADTLYGQAPLSWAAESGYQGVVKVLLERRDVNPNQADTQFGRTPLSWATRFGHEGVVKTLLERADVNPDQADTKYGRTPLSWAARSGSERVVKTLLERADVNPDQADTQYGRTPLSWAAGYGNEGVVKLLLERADVNPDRADSRYGQTPLSWATEYGHEGIVKVLLEREDVNPNTTDTQYGRTPLSWAAGDGHVRIVKLLWDRKDIHTATPDNKNHTPLWWALSEGHEEVARILQQPGKGNPDSTDPGGQASSLPPCAGHEDEPVPEIQFQAGDPNTNITNPNTQHATPSPDPGEKAGTPDVNDPVSKSPDNDLPTEPSTVTQPPSICPPKPPRPPRKPDTYPHTRPTLYLSADRYIIIASFVCFLAIVVYILPSPLDLFSFNK